MSGLYPDLRAGRKDLSAQNPTLCSKQSWYLNQFLPSPALGFLLPYLGTSFVEVVITLQSQG